MWKLCLKQIRLSNTMVNKRFGLMVKKSGTGKLVNLLGNGEMTGILLEVKILSLLKDIIGELLMR